MNRHAAVCCAMVLMPVWAHAALSDEIQVYTDDINGPGAAGVEMHVNTTPKGRKTPDYPGEAVPNHGLRVTPEFSYGLTPTVEAGLYLPTNRDSAGRFELAGAKLRLKWLPLRPPEGGAGWFLGANGELSRLKQRFSQSRSSFELRLMGGYRNDAWLVAVNPVFGWNLSDGLRRGTPDLALATKISRRLGDGTAIGIEYCSELGTTSRVLPWNRQSNSLFAVADLSGKGRDLNVGIGWGVTRSADDLTLKAIVGVPF
jgi:hypothetical protein